MLLLQSATLGSQEGTFDNIRMNTSGDQAQVIRGLLNKFAIRRVAMCCMSSGKGRKQHLVVSHDKGKVSDYHWDYQYNYCDLSVYFSLLSCNYHLYSSKQILIEGN